MTGKRVIIGIGIITAIIVSFATYFFFSNSQPKITNQTVIVGWIGPLTGQTKLLGQDNLNAVQLALAEYNKHKNEKSPTIKLVFADDKSNVELAKRNYQNITQTYHPIAIFINTYSSTFAIAEDARKDKVIIINPIDNDEYISSLKGNVFLIAKQSEDMAAVVANALIDQQRKKVVIFYYADDRFMPYLADTIKNIFQDAGGKTILLPYNKSTKDFKNFLEKGIQENADAYVFLGYPELGFAVRQAREMGIKAPFYGVNTVPDADFQKNAGQAIEDIQFSYFTHLDGNPHQAEVFIKKYIQTYKRQLALEWIALQAYDAANILFYAIEKAAEEEGEGGFFDKVYNNLMQITDYKGVSGNITIQLNGSARGIYPSLYRLHNGKIVKVES